MGRTTPIRCGSYRHTSMDDWLHIWTEVFNLIRGIGNFGSNATEGGGVPDVSWKNHKTSVHYGKRKGTTSETSGILHKPDFQSFLPM